jgi:membrane fusion protein (multidrug efflux system)
MKHADRLYWILAGFLVAMAFPSCKNNEGNGERAIQPVNVRIETLRPQQLIDGIQVAGTARAFEDVNLSPEEGGIVESWAAVKGQHVRKGDLVVALKDEMLKAGLDAAVAQYNLADLNLEKQKKVYAEKGISELQYQSLQYQRDAAKANADLMKARWEHTRLRSPIDGFVDNTIPNVGEFVPPGIPIAHLVNTSTIKIQAEVPELYSGTISTGMPALITFDALPGDTLRGNVAFASSAVSTANRALQIEIVVRNPFQRLKSEMVAKVKLLREIKTDALLVNEDMIQLVDRDRTIVFVEVGGKAVERRLKLGGRQGLFVEVVEGLRAGDHLIVAGYQKVVDGSPVTVVQ